MPILLLSYEGSKSHHHAVAPQWNNIRYFSYSWNEYLPFIKPLCGSCLHFNEAGPSLTWRCNFWVFILQFQLTCPINMTLRRKVRGLYWPLSFRKWSVPMERLEKLITKLFRWFDSMVITLNFSRVCNTCPHFYVLYPVGSPYPVCSLCTCMNLKICKALRAGMYKMWNFYSPKPIQCYLWNHFPSWDIDYSFSVAWFSITKFSITWLAIQGEREEQW